MTPERRERMMDLVDAIRALEDRLDRMRMELRQLVLEDDSEHDDPGIDAAAFGPPHSSS
jgi:hypothetical protein